MKGSEMTDVLDPKHDIYPPLRMARLPRDKRGFIVPKFVAWFRDTKQVNAGYGEPDFRVIDPGHMSRCLRFKLCWLCGEKLGRNMVFVVGPMCVVNRSSGEPPCHLECAHYAVRVCPFMIKPRMRRNDRGLDEIEGAFNPAGLERNPGATALYITKGYKWLGDVKVIRMGEPDRVEWWCEGRPATRAEIEKSIETGIPLLRAAEEGPAAERALQEMLASAMHLLPAA